MIPELDWGAEDGLAYQDLGAIYAQVGWDPGAMGGPVEAAAAGVGGRGPGAGAGAGAGMHRVVHHNHGGGAGGGGRDPGEGWFARGGNQDQMHVWGVQPAPGLARQYATTRHGERGGGALVSVFFLLLFFLLFRVFVVEAGIRVWKSGVYSSLSRFLFLVLSLSL